MKRSLTLLIVLILTVFASFTIVGAQEEIASGLPEADINAYPIPDVKQVNPNEKLMYDRVYRVVTSAVEIFDAPNGNIIGGLGAGFNYVTVLNSQDGWSQISEGKWVKSEFLSEDVLISRFSGIELPDETLPYPMGWLLKHTKASTKPGIDPAEGSRLMYRYTKVNLYSSVEVDGFIWYQIGVDQWIHQFNVAKLLPVERPAEVDTERWISVDLYEQVVIAYEGNTPVFASLVASGLAAWATNEGLFHVYLRYPRTVMSGADGRPDFYYLEEVPWTMYFDDDIALHGTYWHDGFGYRHSHGCVNLSITDAYWLYEWSTSEFDFTVPNDEGPAVYVYSSGEYK